MKGRFHVHKLDALAKRDSCPKLYFSMRKHGVDNFKIKLIGIYNIDDLNERETHFIEKYKTVKKGYNCISSATNKNFFNADRATNIKNTMKDKWKNDKEYKEKTTKANLKAVKKRTMNGTISFKKNDLPYNVNKTKKGYTVRIMRDGKLVIKSVESTKLTDEEKIEKAVKIRDKLMKEMENKTYIDKDTTRLDHNDEELPIGITKRKGRASDGYAINKMIKGKKYFYQFCNSNISLDENLKRAKKKLKKLLKKGN